MQEVFENIIEKLEKKVETAKRIMVPEIHDELDRIANETAESFIEAYKESIEIVKQVVVEYNNGWIPCSERLPERDGEYQLKDFEVTVDNGERIYTSHATYDFHNEKWLVHKKNVIAWKQPCEPYQPKGE